MRAAVVVGVEVAADAVVVEEVDVEVAASQAAVAVAEAIPDLQEVAEVEVLPVRQVEVADTPALLVAVAISLDRRVEAEAFRDPRNSRPAGRRVRAEAAFLRLPANVHLVAAIDRLQAEGHRNCHPETVRAAVHRNCHLGIVPLEGLRNYPLEIVLAEAHHNCPLGIVPAAVRTGQASPMHVRVAARQGVPERNPASARAREMLAISSESPVARRRAVPLVAPSGIVRPSFPPE